MMSLRPSRADLWIERGLFVLSCALLAWALLERFVPAHPVERSGSSLLLAAAMVSATGAPLIASVVARRLAIGVAFVLLLLLFWRL